jgi:hypothetical protein
VAQRNGDALFNANRLFVTLRKVDAYPDFMLVAISASLG